MIINDSTWEHTHKQLKSLNTHVQSQQQHSNISSVTGTTGTLVV